MMSKNVQVNLSKWSIGTKLDPTLEVARAQRLNYVLQLKLYLGLDSFLWEAISKHLLYLCSYHTLVNRYILYLLSVKHQKKKNNNNANSWKEGCSWGIGSWLKICYIYNFVNWCKLHKSLNIVSTLMSFVLKSETHLVSNCLPIKLITQLECFKTLATESTSFRW